MEDSDDDGDDDEDDDDDNGDGDGEPEPAKDESNDEEDGDESDKEAENEAEEDEAETDDEDFVKRMETLDDDMDNISVPLVKISDESKALQFGLDKDKLPTIIYFKNQIPGLFDGDTADTKTVLAWLTAHKTENNIQLVSDPILEDLVDNFPYVACLFTGECAENDEDCETHLEVIVSL